MLKNKVRILLSDIQGDSSHVTLKFRQAVYYLKYPSLRKFVNSVIESNKPVELDKYQRVINSLINSEQAENLTTAQLLPPAIFKLDFYLDDQDKSSFSNASSGECQLVSVLSSIIYHIRNVDSVDEGKRYNYVAILLDEIELYFHPNMQRHFIRKLLETLSKLNNELYGIHVLFATHSPFILSDIQQQKILKLRNGIAEQNENGYNTFAANIHDLLADEFFLNEGYMGAFAQKEIETAINLLNYIMVNNDLRNFSQNAKGGESNNEHVFLQLKLENELSLYKEKLTLLGYWNGTRIAEERDTKSEQRYLQQLIEIIGEPLIRENINNMYRSAFPDNAEDEEVVQSNAKHAIMRMMRENNINLEDLQ
jgi:hypothetical protein